MRQNEAQWESSDTMARLAFCSLLVILPLLVCVRANAQAASGGLSGKVAVASGTGILTRGSR